MEPALWGIFNPDTGHWRNKVFDRQEDARNYADRHTDNYCRLFAIPLFGPDALTTSQARVAELEREREGQGSSVSQSAAMGPQPHVAPEAEPSEAELFGDDAGWRDRGRNRRP